MLSRTLKPRPCDNPDCRTEFTPQRFGQVACSPLCAIVVSAIRKERKEQRQRKAALRVARREKKAGLEKLKTRRDFEREAQRAFNAWIRWRDRFDGCISCHMPATYRGQWHASHYRSTGAAPELRFDEQNVHKSCAQCNTHKSGNVVEFRIRLVAKIGAAAVERLEGPLAPTKRTVDELKAIRKEYAARLRAEQRSKAA